MINREQWNVINSIINKKTNQLIYIKYTVTVPQLSKLSNHDIFKALRAIYKYETIQLTFIIKTPRSIFACIHLQ